MQGETFLFELYTEEIPSFYQIRAISDWHQKLSKLLPENLLEYSRIETGGTSRRIYALIHDLKPNQRSEMKKIKGPPQEMCVKDGAPTPALAGFAKKAGIAEDEVTFESWDNKMYATAQVNTGGQAALDVLPGIFENLIKGQAFTRSMRWGSSSIVYARPVIHYLAMYGSTTLTFASGTWEKLAPAKQPAGHFILGPATVKLANASQYVEAMDKVRITVDPQTRHEKIKGMLQAASGKDSLILSEKLLNEVNFLVERPVVVRGSFAHEFLEMPSIVILSEMEEHQRYFGLKDAASGNLRNEFLIVANGDPEDPEALENIRRGNEKVLRARLADGSYFYTDDRKKKLIERVDDLKRMVFHEALGEGMKTVFDKKERIKEISKIFTPYVYPGVNRDRLLRAGDLIKADLTTHLVYEFDHLQGEIGEVYAEKDGEDAEVSRAISEHYLPRNESDGYPQSKMGLLLSLSDKIDNIISGHLIGKQPTASQDPLGLRRQTLYVIEMLIQNKISVSLQQIFLQLLEDVYKITDQKKRHELTLEMIRFFTGRLATIFEKEDFDKKLINAILDTGGDVIVYAKYLQLDSLRLMKNDENFFLMLATFKRMNNIVKDFLAKNPGKTITPGVEEKLFESPQEKRLFEITNTLIDKISAVSGKERAEYEAVFKYIASVKADVDDFFDNVMVMHEKEEIKINRLGILNNAVTSIGRLLNVEMLQ